MAYRRYRKKRGYRRRRRYGRRYGKKTHRVRTRAFTGGQNARVGRLSRYHGPVARTKLIKLHMQLEMRNPFREDYTNPLSATVPAGAVAAVPLQPFAMRTILNSFPGTNAYGTAATEPAGTSIFSMPGQSWGYSWANEVLDQWDEYQPLAVSWKAEVKPPKPLENTTWQTRVGFLVSYNDKDGAAVLPAKDTSSPNFDYNTWCNFMDVQWARVPRNFDQKNPRFAGFIKMSKFAATGIQSGGAYALRNTWYKLDDDLSANDQIRWPTLWIFATNPGHGLDQSDAGAQIVYNATLYCRVRALVNRDPQYIPDPV